jgi:NAD dependent epimerase/dehydratase family enzyme
MLTEHDVEVRVRRHRDTRECDVVVNIRGREMSIRCRDYNQAVKWAVWRARYISSLMRLRLRGSAERREPSD